MLLQNKDRNEQLLPPRSTLWHGPWRGVDRVVHTYDLTPESQSAVVRGRRPTRLRLRVTAQPAAAREIENRD